MWFSDLMTIPIATLVWATRKLIAKATVSSTCWVCHLYTESHRNIVKLFYLTTALKYSLQCAVIEFCFRFIVLLLYFFRELVWTENDVRSSGVQQNPVNQENPVNPIQRLFFLQLILWQMIFCVSDSAIKALAAVIKKFFRLLSAQSRWSSWCLWPSAKFLSWIIEIYWTWHA